MKQDFYKVTELTKEIQAQLDAIDAELRSGDEMTMHRRNSLHISILSSALAVQLATAQQLTMIAQHLGVIVGRTMGKDEAGKKAE